MADKLMFPIGFDLDDAVKTASKDWESTYRSKLEKIIRSKPIKLEVEVDTKGIDKSTVKEDLSKMGDSILGIKKQIKELNAEWNKMAKSMKFDTSGNLSAEAEEMVRHYKELIAEAASYGETLEKITSKERKAAEAKIRDAERAAAAARKEAETLKLTESSIDNINAKIKVWQSRMKSSEVGSSEFLHAAEEVKRLKAELAFATEETKKLTGELSKPKPTEVEKLRAALSATETTLAGLNAKIRAYQQFLQGRDIGSGIWNRTALEIRRLSEEIAAATQRLQDFQQESFKGLSNDWTVAEVNMLTKLRDELKKTDEEFNRLNASGAAYNKDGSFTSDANNLLKKRMQIIRQINDMTKTAADAQAEREQQINRIIEQRRKKQEAIVAKRKEEQAAIQRNIANLKAERRILVQQENSIANITAKLRIQQERLNNAQFGSNEFKRAADEVERLTKKLEEAKEKIETTSEAEKKRAAAARSTTEAYKTQDTYISRLLKRTAVLFSIATVSNFLRQIREVTAEFELQRVSLGAIIQDTQKANNLFNQIKAFAVKSPFEIKDLVSYTKQLAAYSIGADELFDTMKRLADVSAGLGVDMQRIILAYGQVKAASVLRGTELRQFTEAGIPLVQLLAEKFTQLRGEMVSTGEVFDLISNRAVSFEMVKEIFEDMTNAGGMFYEMQEKQSETLAGQWSNLKDAYSIMLDEMGNSAVVLPVMQGLIDLTKELFDHWKGMSSFIAGAGIAMISYNKHMNSSAVTVEKTIRAEKRLEAQRIRAMAIGRKLTDFEREYLVLNNQLLASDYKRIITEGKLGPLQLVRLARQSKNNVELEKGIVLSKAMTIEQVKQIQSAGKLNYLWGVMRVRLQSIGAAIKDFGRALAGSWPILLITSIISLITDYAGHLQALDEALEKNDKAHKEYENTLKRIENAYLSAKKAAEQAKEADEDFAKTAYGDKLKQLQEIAKLLDAFGLKNIIDFSIVDVENIDPIIEKWLAKLNEVNQSTKKIGDAVADIATAFEGNIMGWSVFGENLNTDMKDLNRAWRKLQSNKSFSSELERMRLYVDEMSNKSEDFYKHLSDAVGEDAKLALSAKRRNESDVQYWQRIIKNYELINGLTESYNIIKGPYKYFAEIPKGQFESALKEVMHEFDSIKDELEGQDPLQMKMTIDRVFLQNQWDDTLKEWFITEANRKWKLNIPVSFSFANEAELTSGIRSIIRNEFPGLFTDEELKNLTTASAVVDAIAQRRDEALKNLKNVQKLQNNIVGSSQKYESVIKSINEELKKEEAKPAADRDDNKITSLRNQLVAMQSQNGELDKQIEKEKELAKAEYERLDAAYKRVASTPLSTIAEDVSQTFPQIIADAIKSATDKDYQIGLYVSEDSLSNISNIGDLYDNWVQSNKKIEEEQKKIAEFHVADKVVEQERAELAERLKNASEELADVEQRLSDNKYKDQTALYSELKARLAMSTTQSEIEQSQKAINEFLNNENNALFASLILRKEELEAILAQKKTSGELANEQIDAYKKMLEERKKINEEIAKRYGFTMPADDKKGSGGGEDPWIILMKNRMKFMQDFQKGVENLSKFLQNDKALGQEQDIMLFRGKSLDIDVKQLEGTQKELEDWYDDAIEQVSKKIAKLGGKMWEGLGVQAILAKDTKSRIIKAYQELLQDLFNQKTDFQTGKLKEQLQKELTELSNDISRTKTAKEFFDKMLNLTGDREFTTNITMSVYGSTGEDLFENMKRSIEKQFGNVDISLAIDTVNGIINYDELDRLYEIYRERIPEEYRKGIEKMIADGKKQNADNIKMWTEQLAKVKSFEEKKTEITRTEAEKRNNIIKSMMPEEEKQVLIKLSYENEKKQLADIDMEEFKASDDYIKAFGDLDELSQGTIDRLIERIKKLIEESQKLGGEGTEGMKTLVNTLTKLQKKAEENDPIQGMINSAHDYIEAKKEQVIAERELEAARQKYAEQEGQLNAAIEQSKIEEAAAYDKVFVAQENYNSLIEEQKRIEKSGGDPATLQERVAFAKQQVVTAELELNAATEKTLQAENDKAKAIKEVEKAEKKVTDSQDKAKKASDKFREKLGDAGKLASKMSEALSSVVELLGIAEDSDLGAALGGAIEALNKIVSVITTMIVLIAAFNAICAANPILAVATAVLAVGGAIANVFSSKKIKKANEEIERQQELIDNLQRSYDKLKDKMDKVFGNKRTQNVQEQIKNLNAQRAAIQKQIDAELSKPKGIDEEKVKQWREEDSDLKDQIKELKESYNESFLGTDLAGAARTFVQSWLEAYKEFGDTRKAIEESMEDMMDNLITEAVLGSFAQAALKPLFDYVNSLADDTEAWTKDDTWREIARLREESINNVETSLQVSAGYVKEMGMLTRRMGGELTGISKDIANASEESILGLAAGINTQNFYISHIDATTSQILAIMQGGNPVFSSNEQMTDLITIQNQHLSYLPRIEQNTSEILLRCERAAIACETLSSNLGRVVTPKGVKGSFQVNVAM